MKKRNLKLKSLTAGQKEKLAVIGFGTDEMKYLSHMAFAATLTGAAAFMPAYADTLDDSIVELTKPTLDTLYENGTSPVASKFTWVEIDVAEGAELPANTIAVGDKYYQWQYKENTSNIPISSTVNLVEVDNTKDGAILFNNKYYAPEQIEIGTGSISKLYSYTPKNLKTSYLSYNYAGWTTTTDANTADIVTYYSDENQRTRLITSNTDNYDTIDGNFINQAFTDYGSNHGSSVNNAGVINNLSANFTDNYIQSSSGYNKDTFGGAVYNTGTINNVSGNYINNRATNSVYYTTPNVGKGGAIYNSGNIGNITGSYFFNGINGESSGTLMEYVQKAQQGLHGGAIYNTGDILKIDADFIGNYIFGCTEKFDETDPTPEIATLGGAAIYNTVGTIHELSGDFIGNYAIINLDRFGNRYNHYTKVYGGALYNESVIGDITSNFVNNNIAVYPSGGKTVISHAKGGAVYNTNQIGNMVGDFIGNKINASYGDALGGAIYNTGDIASITGNFYNNELTTRGNIGNGGAIYNNGNINDINGSFVNNSVTVLGYGTQNTPGGGAIYNEYNGVIKNIFANFSDNKASSGGAITNNGGKINNISGDFVNNSSDYYGVAIYNNMGGYYTGSGFTERFHLMGYGNIGTINGNFINNKSTSTMTATIYNTRGSVINTINGNFINNSTQGIYNEGTINTITGNFIGNKGAAVTNQFGGSITTINANFYDNTDRAIYNNTYTNISKITGDFVGNSVENNYYGGALYIMSGVDEISGNFINNYAKSTSGEVKGGAIAAYVDLNIVADNRENIFKGNYTDSAGVIDDNAIYAMAGTTTINFDIKNNGSVKLYDNVRGADGYKVNIAGDGTGTMHLFNDLYDANLSIGNVNLNTINNNVHTYAVKSFTLNGDVNMTADVDLNAQTMDRFEAEDYQINGGKFNVVGMNLLSDAPSDRKITEIYFAQQGLKDHVVSHVSDVGAGSGNVHQTTAYTPIYKYNVMYDNRDDAGYFVFTKGDTDIVPTPGGGYNTRPNGNRSNAFNPAILATPVNTQAAAVSTMNMAASYAFEHADTFMAQPEYERFTEIYRDRVALSTDFNENREHIDLESVHNKAVWTKPYTAFESIPLKHGPKIDSITYGTIIGYDSDIKILKHGWANVATAYMGYHGTQTKYDKVDASSNGGILGLTETFYKGNFFTAFTASAGAGVNETHTMYGKEDTTFLMAGLANKTGYNFEFKEGKFILQPMLFTSYTMAKTFDYTSASGVRVKSDPAHYLQISPSIKFITNFKNGWQPYASVGMVWDVMHKSDIRANGVKLPQMYTKPYIQYGVGLQKNWADKFSAYGQAMVRNGGRRGISLTFGFRWAFGNPQKELTNTPVKTKKSAKVKAPKKVTLQKSTNVKPLKITTLKKSNFMSAAIPQTSDGRAEVKIHNASDVPEKSLLLKRL